MFGRAKNRPSVATDINVLLNAVDQHRERIAAVRSEREAVARAPRPMAETLAALDDHLDNLATSAVDGLQLGSMLHRDRPLTLRLPFRLDAETRAVDASAATSAVLGLLIATCRPAFRGIIEGQLQDLMRDRPGMSDGEQAARLAALDAQLLSVELAEEAAIRALERAGLPVLRRPDARPLALLASDEALPTA